MELQATVLVDVARALSALQALALPHAVDDPYQ
jgi:hypothetical protein